MRKKTKLDGDKMRGKVMSNVKKDKTINNAKNCKISQTKSKKCNKNAKNGKIINFSNALDAFDKNEKSVVLGEIGKMRIWVKTLLSIYGTIPNIIKIIDKIIVSQASNPYGSNFGIDSYGQIEKVIDYVDRKIKLTNINLMTQKLIDSAIADERELIEMRFDQRLTANEIANYLGIDLRSVFRKIEKVISRLADIAIIKGWTSRFVSSQLTDEAWVIERFNDYYDEYQKRLEKTKNNSKDN